MVMQIEPQHWASSSFKGERYNHITDDVGGSLAKLMEDYQESSILHKIDALIRTMIDAITDAKLDAWWKETGLPCRHSLAVFALIGRNPYEYCANYFTVDAYRLTYLESIKPSTIENGRWVKVQSDKNEGKTNGDNDYAEKEDCEKTEAEDEHIDIEIDEAGLEKEESMKVGGENEEAAKVENEKMEVQIDDGVKGKISETNDDPNVLVLPPIPVKPAVVKENIEWEEKEVETTKRTVTCTKCKQTGHNKKSCNFYQAQQAGELTFVN
ncbi:hypothetical protein Tco_1044988 [Tanacetum coccineum]|uniref:Zinc finger PMZ-type domain-containing protein n=1 Tax=Tanacetum coccineum TaxID=301880 RepID=A0ABQ5GTZ1_9ASTR